MPEILRVALLGGGKMALQHAAAIRQCRHSRLVAVADSTISAAELKERFGRDIAAYTDPHELLTAVRPDVVHVVTPPDTHATLAHASLEAGANVYVEKPFALNTTDAESVLRLAKSKGLRVCAAHQLLFQDSARSYRRHLPGIGDVVHVESFFSFRPVRRRAGGGGLSTPVEQLIDILPHPTYLLLDSLPDTNGTRPEIAALEVSIDGEVRAIVRCGRVLACLVVSLRARPIESWLRAMGTNGMVDADFVLGNVISHPGPGASAPAIVLKPFSRAWQIAWGSFCALLKLLFRRRSGYPGLAELIDLFHASILERTASPISASDITDTVRICEAIATRLRLDENAADVRAAIDLTAKSASLSPLNARGVVLLTGGTGTLGRPTAEVLRTAGWRVRVPVRRNLSPRDQVAGIEYVTADLAEHIADSLLDGVEVVVHLAAETAGSKEDHKRNTIQVMRNLLDAMARMGTRRLVNVSSLAVLKPSGVGQILNESSPVDFDNLARGPYVWAKAAAERMALGSAESGLVEVRTLRLGPLVDYNNLSVPGRLGREVARSFVAIGRPSNRLSVCTVSTATKVLSHAVTNFEAMQPIVNLVEVPAPTRGELAQRLKTVRPDLWFVWLPFWILRPLSAGLRVILKLVRPNSPALDLYSAFKSERYDDSIAKQLTTATD